MPPDPPSLFPLKHTQWPYQSKIVGAGPEKYHYLTCSQVYSMYILVSFPDLSIVLCSITLDGGKGWGWSNVASFPGLSNIQFLITCSGGGRPGIFYPVNDVSVYLGRQRGEGSLIERTHHFTRAFFISNQ